MWVSLSGPKLSRKQQLGGAAKHGWNHRFKGQARETCSWNILKPCSANILEGVGQFGNLAPQGSLWNFRAQGGSGFNRGLRFQRFQRFQGRVPIVWGAKDRASSAAPGRKRCRCFAFVVAVSICLLWCVGISGIQFSRPRRLRACASCSCGIPGGEMSGAAHGATVLMNGQPTRRSKKD